MLRACRHLYGKQEPRDTERGPWGAPGSAGSAAAVSAASSLPRCALYPQTTGGSLQGHGWARAPGPSRAPPPAPPGPVRAERSPHLYLWFYILEASQQPEGRLPGTSGALPETPPPGHQLEDGREAARRGAGRSRSRIMRLRSRSDSEITARIAENSRRRCASDQAGLEPGPG